MWIHVWKGAVLLTKAGRVVVPTIIAGAGALVGFVIGRKRKNSPPPQPSPPPGGPDAP